MKEMSSIFFLTYVCCQGILDLALQEPSLDPFLVIILIAAQLVCAKNPSPH